MSHLLTQMQTVLRETSFLLLPLDQLVARAAAQTGQGKCAHITDIVSLATSISSSLRQPQQSFVVTLPGDERKRVGIYDNKHPTEGSIRGVSLADYPSKKLSVLPVVLKGGINYGFRYRDNARRKNADNAGLSLHGITFEYFPRRAFLLSAPAHSLQFCFR